jgi:alcohol dehydrogenase/propanol-preferring alcohol dehydrogenase
MKAWAVVAHEAPLECVELADPEPTGTEVVVAVTRCGVCHSDLHLWHGGYDLGGGRMLSVKDRGLVLPAAPGHEIAGRVVRIGPDAKGVAIGDERAVYPWIGCGDCARCAAEEDNLCTRQRSLGVSVNGGFARLVKVPHPRYLLEFDGIDPSLAATYACSGLTAYSAVRKVLPLDAGKAVVVMGAGGVGLAAVAMLKALGHANIVCVDISPDKQAAALAAGASHFVDGAGDDLVARIQQAAGEVGAAIDFVGADATAGTAMAVLPKAGKLVLVGVGGGELTLSVAGTIFRALTVVGSLTGTIQDFRDVLDLARQGRLVPTPIREMEKHFANDALRLLVQGQAIGRLVLTDDDPVSREARAGAG